MSEENNSGKNTGNQTIILEDKGLAPASSGTPMPKVKPAAKPVPTTSQGSDKANK